MFGLGVGVSKLVAFCHPDPWYISLERVMAAVSATKSIAQLSLSTRPKAVDHAILG